MKSLIHSILFFFAISISLFVNAQDMEPDSVNAILNVSVLNEMGKTNAGDTISFKASKSGEVFSGVTDEFGKFTIKVPNGQILVASYRDMGGKMQSSDLDLPGNQLLIINWELMFELPRVYTLDNVFFVSGKSTLTPASYTEIKELAEVMEFKKSMTIEISGHTDDVGDNESNQRLSESRAFAVRAYLMKVGIDGARIEAIGHGETRFIAKNDTPEGRAKNRRTEVRVLGGTN